MSEEKITKLEELHEKHNNDINELKTNHKVHLAHHKALDGRIEHIDGRVDNVEDEQTKAASNITWAIRIILGMVIMAVVSLVIKNGGAL